MNIKKKYNDFINIIDESKNKIIIKKEIINTHDPRKIEERYGELARTTIGRNLDQRQNAQNAQIHNNPIISEEKKINDVPNKLINNTLNNGKKPLTVINIDEQKLNNKLINIINSNDIEPNIEELIDKECNCYTSTSGDITENVTNIIKQEITIFDDNLSVSQLEEKQTNNMELVHHSIPPNSTQELIDLNKSEDLKENKEINGELINDELIDDELMDDEFMDEFDMIINNNIEIIQKEDLNTMNKQINNLEDMFNKEILKKINTNDSKLKKNNNIFKGDILKKISLDIEEKIFIESTRGFNIKENVFKIRMDKLKEKIKIFESPILFTIGYIYRDFNNPKSFLNEDINSYWLDINKKDGSMTESYLNPHNKLLQACLKNLATNNKFKKKINDENIRAFKKTVQINNNNFIIDIIFYVKNKINNTII